MEVLINKRIVLFTLSILIASVLFFFGVNSFFSFVIISLLMIVLMIGSNINTNIVFLLWPFFSTSGVWGIVYNLPISGFLCTIIAFILLLNKRNQKIIKDFFRVSLYLFPFIIISIIAYSYGPQNSYSNTKLFNIIYKGLFFILPALVLLSEKDIDYKRLGILTLLCVFQFFLFIELKSSWSGISSITDFGSMRDFFYSEYDSNLSLFNYQSIGLLSILSITFFLFSKDKKTNHNKFLNIIVLSLNILLILFTGSRQALFTLPILFSTVYLFNPNIKIINKLRALLIAFSIFILLLGSNLFSETVFNIDRTKSFGEIVNRSTHYIEVQNVLDSDLIWGLGLGGYSSLRYGERYFPHNIFLELLCEYGLVLTIAFILIIIFYLSRINFKLAYKTKAYFHIWALFIILFVRANISSDLIENINVFSFLFVWIYCTKHSLTHENSPNNI